jgi:hypothetical protein
MIARLGEIPGLDPGPAFSFKAARPRIRFGAM